MSGGRDGWEGGGKGDSEGVGEEEGHGSFEVCRQRGLDRTRHQEERSAVGKGF